MALSSRSNLKTFLRITTTDTTQDTYLDQLLSAADAIVKGFCKRSLEEATLTEYYDGNGTQYLPLRSRPVSSVTSVYLDEDGFYGDGASAFPSESALTAGSDFALKRDGAGGISKCGLLVRLGGSVVAYAGDLIGGTSGQLATLSGRATPIWPVGNGNIKVVYVAGYAAASIPDDLENALHSLAAYIRTTTPIGTPLDGQIVEKLTNTLRYAAGQIPEIGSIRETLVRYRELPVA